MSSSSSLARSATVAAPFTSPSPRKGAVGLIFRFAELFLVNILPLPPAHTPSISKVKVWTYRRLVFSEFAKADPVLLTRLRCLV